MHAAVSSALAAAAALLALASPADARQPGQSIVAAGQAFDVGRPVVLWRDKEGFDGYAQTCLESRALSRSPCCARTFNRFSARRELTERTLPALQAVVSQVVLHQDGCVNSRSCFYSMHDMPGPTGRCGLSAHFMVDADGTIYQTLDLLENAWHAEQANGISIGIEICNRGDASRNELHRLPKEYSTRPTKNVVINGHTFKAFDFRPEQYTSVIALVRTLVRILPRVKPVFPELNGRVLLGTLDDPSAFEGIVGHLHVDKQGRKWDPGAFDWGRLKSALRGYHFPIAVRGYDEVPEDPEELRRAALAFFQNSEARASGYFPMGTGGLWHSGVHLRGVPGEPVRAPFRGRLVAARLGEREGSSTAFVLLRHDVEVRGEPFPFFTLLAHLSPHALSGEARPVWLREVVARAKTDGRALAALEAGRVALLDVPVEAGDVVGTIGWVRRGAEWGPEVHFETFTVQRAPEVIDRTFQQIAAAADGPIVERGGILGLVDGDGNGRVTPVELRTFFREGDPLRRHGLRHLAVRHVHEWGDRAGRHGKLSPVRARLYEAWEGVSAPYLFWDDALSAHTGLPESQTVYSYHPITFLASLAAAERKTSVSWPKRLAVEAGEATLGAPGPGDFSTPRDAALETEPIFGPVVDGEAVVKKRSEIELYELPSAH